MSNEEAKAKNDSGQQKTGQVASSDELDHYIKVTNPSAWVVVIAALLLLGGILVWAITAVVPVTVETTGVVPIQDNPSDAKVLCIVDKTTADRMQGMGATAFIDGVEAESVQLEKTPLSASEVLSLFGSDFYADSIKINDWNYLVVVKPSELPSHTDFAIQGYGFQANLVPVSIVVAETRPITIISGNLS